MFPGGPPPQYDPGPNWLDFADRTRCGIFQLVWSNAIMMVPFFVLVLSNIFFCPDPDLLRRSPQPLQAQPAAQEAAQQSAGPGPSVFLGGGILGPFFNFSPEPDQRERSSLQGWHTVLSPSSPKPLTNHRPTIHRVLANQKRNFTMPPHSLTDSAPTPHAPRQYPEPLNIPINTHNQRSARFLHFSNPTLSTHRKCFPTP